MQGWSPLGCDTVYWAEGEKGEGRGVGFLLGRPAMGQRGEGGGRASTQFWTEFQGEVRPSTCFFLLFHFQIHLKICLKYFWTLVKSLSTIK